MKYYIFACRGTGTDIMELNTDQDMARIYQEPLFIMFLYLWKIYDTLDRGRLLQTLEGYGAGLKLHGILE